MVDPQSLAELVLVRIRGSQGRTYWMAGDETLRLTFPPHVTQQMAVARCSAASGRAYGRIVLYPKHQTASAARKLLDALLAGARHV